MAVMIGNNAVDFDDLFRYNYRPLCLYALHYLGDADMAEDVVQESYTVLWEKLHEGTEVLNRRAYLYMMMLWSVLRQRRVFGLR